MDFLGANGGQLWVWAARPQMCCLGAPAWMYAATAAPDGMSGFLPVALAFEVGAPGLRVHFRPVAGQRPEVLEIGMRGRRKPRVAAYWDGCQMAMV